MISEETRAGDIARVNSPAPARPNPHGLHDMTQGPVRGHLLRMMWFVLAGMAIQTLYGLVDIYWVGRLGKQAVAAVALSSNLMFVSLALTQTLSVGCVALVSQAAGKKSHAEVQRLFNQAQSLSTCAGLFFLIFGLALRHTYAEKLSGDPLTAELASTFLLGFIPALALQFLMVGLGSALRGIGDMKPGLIAQTASVLLNLLLAPFLIFGWIGGHPLGVSGASLATLISTVVAVAGLGIYLARGTTFLRLDLSLFRPNFSTWRAMIAIGVPAGTEFLLLSVTMGVIYSVTRAFGPQAQAGFGIGSRLMQAGFMPAVAISFATAAVIGQNFGLGAFARVREARRESSKVTLAFMLLFTAVCQVIPEQMVARFSTDPEVIAAGVDYLRTISWAYALNGVIFVSAGVFQGLGNTWPSLAASIIRALCFSLPTLGLSTRGHFAMHTIWLISLAAVVVQFAIQQALLGRELRRRAPV